MNSDLSGANCPVRNRLFSGPGSSVEFLTGPVQAFDAMNCKVCIWKAISHKANLTSLKGTYLPISKEIVAVGFDHYEAITRGDTMMMALLKLWLVEKTAKPAEQKGRPCSRTGTIFIFVTEQADFF